MKKKMYKFLWMFALVLGMFITKTEIAYAENESAEQKVYTYGDFKYENIEGTEYINIIGYTGSGELVVYPGEIDGRKCSR